MTRYRKVDISRFFLVMFISVGSGLITACFVFQISTDVAVLRRPSHSLSLPPVRSASLHDLRQQIDPGGEHPPLPHPRPLDS